MFDPLSNFKLNKIKKAVEALPTTLSSSFTEVKNAIAGVQNITNTINTNVNAVSAKVNTINTSVNNLANESFYERNLIIPKSDLLNYKYVSNDFSNGSGTRNVVNVSGKGALLMAHVDMESPWDNNFYCSIIIDGKTIKLDRTSNGNSTLMLSNVNYANLFGIGATGIGLKPNYLSYSEINNGVTFRNEYSVIRLFDGYVEFNKSLSVVSYKDESDSACRVNVELIYALS